jgi:ribonuclease Z
MMKLFFVGAGTPTPTPSRFGTSYVLQIEDDYLMFDCGPSATHKLVKLGLWPTLIDHLFFTHHHFDHDADYPCFLLCHWDQSVGKEKKLRIWGPRPMADFHDRLFGENGAFSYDWKARVGNPGSQAVFQKRGGKLPRPKPDYDVTEIGPGEVIATQSWKVTAAPAQHIEPFMPTLAYRVDSPQGSVAFSSDTGPCQSVIALARDVDTFVVHCWDHQDGMSSHLAKMITGTVGAAKLAAEVGARTLVLSHQGAGLDLPGSKERAIIDVSRHFSGKVVFAEELMILTL